MNYKKISPEVFYAKETFLQVDDEAIEFLISEAEKNARKRSRLCAHLSPDAPLHEMLIVHFQDAYVRPHRHFRRIESFHVISGEADVVLFDEQGNVSQVVPMGGAGHSKTFYYRQTESVFHSMLIRSPVFVFHEVTNGPFDPSTTEFPSWAPSDNDPSLPNYLQDLESRVQHYLKSR